MNRFPFPYLKASNRQGCRTGSIRASFDAVLPRVHRLLALIFLCSLWLGTANQAGAGGLNILAVQEFWEIDGSKKQFSDVTRVSYANYGGSGSGVLIGDFKTIVYLNSAGDQVSAASSSVFYVAYLIPLETTVNCAFTGTATATRSTSVQIFFDSSAGRAMRPYYISGYDPFFIATMKYILVRKNLTISTEDRVIGQNTPFRTNGTEDKKLGQTSVYRSSLGYVPAITLTRKGASGSYVNGTSLYVSSYSASPEPNADDSTRYRLSPAGWEFWANGSRRSYDTSAVKTAYLAADDIESYASPLQMRWMWSARRYRLIDMQVDLEWTQGATLTDGLPTTGVTSWETQMVAPEINRVFSRPPILYLDANMQNPTLQQDSATAYQASPQGWRYAIKNAGNGTLNPNANVNDASLDLSIDLAHNASSDSNEYENGVLTWIYQVDQQLTGLSVTSSGLASGFVLPSESVKPAAGFVQSGSTLTFSAPREVYWDENRLNGSTNYFEGARYQATLKGHTVSGADNPDEGSLTQFEVTVNGPDEVSVNWEWEMHYGITVKSAAGTGGNPATSIGNDSVEGVNIYWVKKDTQVTFSVDSSSGENPEGTVRGSVESYLVTTPGATNSTVVNPSVFTVDRITSNQYTITDWIEFEWRWAGQIKYTFDALTADENSVPLDGQAFVRVYPVPGTPGTVETHYASGQNFGVWIPNTGRRVEVGSFYRTSDREWTLGDFPVGLGGDLVGTGKEISTALDELVADESGQARVARVYNILEAKKPTTVHWVYLPTVFRAEVPLGQALDAGSLVPRLPDAAELDEAGPDEAYVTVGEPVTGGKGLPCRWDQVGRKLYPVHPGSNQVDWGDKNEPGKKYKIEMVSGYPGEWMPLASEREDPDGNGLREVSLEPNLFPVLRSTGDGEFFTEGYYVFQTPEMADVGEEFPAAPTAHYRHLLDPNEIPTLLDPSGSDEWKFQDLTYGESDTARPDTVGAGVPFNASEVGRSVLLFSYRPNPDEVANGDLSKEKLAVRIVSSSEVRPIEFDADTVAPQDPRLVLGRRGFELGTPVVPGEAVGILSTTSAQSTMDPGSDFVVDFWLNAKGYGAKDEPVTVFSTGADALSVTLDNHLTETIVKLVAEDQPISVPFAFESGTVLQVVNTSTGETLENGTDYTVPSDGSAGSATGVITLLDTDLTSTGDDLRIQHLAPSAVGTTITVQYQGEIVVTHPFSRTGAAWRHFVVQITESTVGPSRTQLHFYADGVHGGQGVPTSELAGPGGAESVVETSATSDSMRFGVGANPRSHLQLDQFRLFGAQGGGELKPAEVQQLRTTQDMTLRGSTPLLWFGFENEPDGTNSLFFYNEGTLPGVGLGPMNVPVETDNLAWAHIDLHEVATRLESTLDNAGFGGTGYIISENSNYNGDLYQRDAVVGTWGPIFPVNDSLAYKNMIQTDPAGGKHLQVAYYENPFLVSPQRHPNVAWPYVAARYADVTYPRYGAHKDKAIYIASRIGSEGVDQNGRLQPVYDLARYSDLKIYSQPSKNLPGYNPNEEHALVAPAGRAALKIKNLGEDIPNTPPLAAFALQRDINVTTDDVNFTSKPWVLVQVNNLVNGESEMAAYQVFKDRVDANRVQIRFPRPENIDTGGDTGLAYESAENPEDRFLTIDPNKSYDFKYDFSYTAAAGDLLIPPYPLNLVIGNVAMADARGNSMTNIYGLNQRTLWRDVNKNAWVVSGDGNFIHQFFYPFRSDFHLQSNTPVGTPVAWVPDDAVFTGVGTNLAPRKVVYETFWRSDYPKLKRGETMTYQGGEYFNGNPGSKGLPALVAMAAAEIVYDSASPSMIFGDAAPNRYPIRDASAEIVRPLDRREALFKNAEMKDAGFSPAGMAPPATSDVFIVAERWYFKELPGSLQARFYFDSLAEKLVFRGRLNGKESGDPDLTAGPDPINVLEPNVMTPDQYSRIQKLSSNPRWLAEVKTIYDQSKNPNGVVGATGLGNLQGIKNAPLTPVEELVQFLSRDFLGQFFQVVSPSPQVVKLDSFGVGSALVPNSGLLTQRNDGSLYITIAENNRSELNGAPVSLHIIEIIPDRYRGAIKVIEAADAFSEKISLQHNGEFGANTGDLYYEWWIRDAAPLDSNLGDEIASLATATPDPDWQEYLPASRATDNSLNLVQKHLGLHSIVFEGSPNVTLADKLVLMRYRHKTESGWTLVPFEVANAAAAWQPGTPKPALVPPGIPAPFQWAGAANSPQLQADGSKRYVPQLIMGWVKRVLDRINPYEARYTDFFSNESPATYSSQIQIAGAPFAGKVALNPDKNVVENVGLIELYETVLARARELSIDNSSNGNATDGVKQALLLAATRLSVLYEILAREAYSDAQDSTITVSDDSGLGSVVSFTHAFQNMEADLMHEELALLRGTDFLKSYPVYNRIFWNYAKGLGEAAYNVNYNIHDENLDGFINEDDARALYPQGHGDAWGHFVSAIDMHYTLLQHPGFSWKTRSELYSLMQNVLEVDFLDEKTFAKLAAGKARAGRDIVRGTYRLNYTQDSDGQWQGYTDGADSARAWGVSEWAHRTGQGAYFDWAVANALLPEESPDPDPDTPVNESENLDRIERLAAIDEIAEVAGGLYEIQIAMDEANGGVNPLGFNSDTIAFDLNLEFYENTSGGDRRSHFEQIYNRALVAGGNALATLEFASQAENKLRNLATDTGNLLTEAFRQDLDYRNRLIEIFGRPYDGTIGFGKVYPEGYEGPDTLLFAYLDYNKVEQIAPTISNASDGFDFEEIKVLTGYTRKNLADYSELEEIYEDSLGDTGQLDDIIEVFVEDLEYVDFSEDSERTELQLPVRRTAAYAFTPPPDSNWGQRTSYGRLQQALEGMLLEELMMLETVEEYQALLKHYHTLTLNLEHEIVQAIEQENIGDKIETARRIHNIAKAVYEAAILTSQTIQSVSEATGDAVAEAFPTSVGFSTDVTSAARAVAKTTATVASESASGVEKITKLLELAAEIVKDELIADWERDKGRIDIIDGIENSLGEIARFGADEGAVRAKIGIHIQQLEILRQGYFTAQAEGFRLLREREAFNKILAATVQGNRYNDMIFRLSRNEAMSKYQSAFNHAARYAWLAAKAYDYETSLDPGDPAAPGDLLDQIIKERQLGLWVDGQPQSGQGGLAELLNHMNGNFQVLKGQLGIDNPQSEIEKISLRGELFRIRPHNAEDPAASEASDNRWKDALNIRIEPDLTRMPEFVRYCRPFSTPEEGRQPGIVIRFGSEINNGVNFFGRALAAGDHAYSTANYATKIRGFGVWLENYNAAGLATTPRAYLVPVGNDYLRTSSSDQPMTRVWNVMEQRIPTPFTINQSALTSPGFIPTLNGVDGGFGQLRRHGDFRMYHDSGDPTADDSELILDSRLISRSVWNSEWLLIIPGAGLHIDPEEGLKQLADNITDIKLHFMTYSHQGQ